MVTEDYVSFETAKLLKEKGFEGENRDWYNMEGFIEEIGVDDGIDLTAHEDIFNNVIPAPTLQMAVKWLREVYDIFIAINIIPNITVTMEQRYYFFKPYKNRRIHNFPLDYSIQCYETYEEACEAGIRYCLENLI